MATDSPCPDQNEAEGDREDGLEEITVDDIQAYLDA
jgi:hypothetical protein